MERCVGTGGQVVCGMASLDRKKTWGNKNDEEYDGERVKSAWGSLKDRMREAEAAASAVTQPLELRMGS